jgi:hypothetical protein
LQHCGPAGRWNHSNSSVSPEHRILITIKIGKNKKNQKKNAYTLIFLKIKSIEKWQEKNIKNQKEK